MVEEVDEHLTKEVVHVKVTRRQDDFFSSVFLHVFSPKIFDPKQTIFALLFMCHAFFYPLPMINE